MKIFIASDHAGFESKTKVYEHLIHRGYDIEDLGPFELDPQDDYPNYAFKTTTKVLGSTDADARGILLCGSGQGMAMAANRTPGIRAAVAWSKEVAHETRADNDSNVLSLPVRMIDEGTALDVVDTWLETKFSDAPRHRRRLEEIESIYG